MKEKSFTEQTWGVKCGVRECCFQSTSYVVHFLKSDGNNKTE